MDTEAIMMEVEGMTPEERDRTLVQLIKANTEWTMRFQREVGRPRQILNQLVELAQKAERGEDVLGDILATIRFYRDNA